MDNRIDDLDVLFPRENDVIKFTDKSGNKYEVPVFIPVPVGFLIIENIDKLVSIFPGGNYSRPVFGREAFELMQDVIVAILQSTYKEITVEWARKNLSLVKQAYILFKFIVPVYEFLSTSGFLESVMPQPKKPME